MEDHRQGSDGSRFRDRRLPARRLAGHSGRSQAIHWRRATAPTLQAQLPISDLDGLTVWHEARLEEEDIENIPNMATADLVDLLINTRFPPDRLIDWVDQAILYTHLGPAAKKDEPGAREILRSHGIRTASSLIEVHGRSDEHGTTAALDKMLDDPAAQGPSRLQSLVDAVQTNPNLALIQTWRGMHAPQHANVIAKKTA